MYQHIRQGLVFNRLICFRPICIASFYTATKYFIRLAGAKENSSVPLNPHLYLCCRDIYTQFLGQEVPPRREPEPTHGVRVHKAVPRQEGHLRRGDAQQVRLMNYSGCFWAVLAEEIWKAPTRFTQGCNYRQLHYFPYPSES